MSSRAIVIANCRSLTDEELAPGQGKAVLRRTSRVAVSTPSANHAELPAEMVAELPRTQGTRPR